MSRRTREGTRAAVDERGGRPAAPLYARDGRISVGWDEENGRRIDIEGRKGRPVPAHVLGRYRDQLLAAGLITALAAKRAAEEISENGR